MTEEWRPVPGHPQFEASSLARIRTHDRVIDFVTNGKSGRCRLRGRVVSPFLGKNGYLSVSYKEEGKRTKYLVHRLVGLAFVPGHEPGLTINHIDGVKTHNLPANLEWITKAANTAHQWSIGLVNLRGENHPGAKLSDAEVEEIRCRLKAGETHATVAQAYSVSGSLIGLIGQGKKRVAA